MGRKIIIIIFQKSIDKMKWCGIIKVHKVYFWIKYVHSEGAVYDRIRIYQKK